MLDFNKIEKKWQSRWEKKKIFKVKQNNKKKYYILEMFPYPSGSGLHIGHAFNYVIGDIYSRFKRMNGLNVLYPMGYDSLGLPAENAAIKAGIHPRIYTEDAIKNFINQQKSLGLSYDWDRIIETHKPEYYKWDQWIFLQMFKKGLAFRKKAPVNWCSKCNTVLANEQVHNGKCWIHTDADVEIRYLEQWFLKITNYAKELYDVKELEYWPDDIKAMQKNWIGKSEGTEILFEINGEHWPIFTTRTDTLFGVTFMVISAQHPRLMGLVKSDYLDKVVGFLKKIKSTKQEDMDKLEKEGVFTGSYAIHPLTNEKLPIYVGNFVIAEYGSGMVMAVPAHDQRDFDFAKRYSLPIKEVIKGGNIKERAYVDEGILINSNKFNGMPSKKAIKEISKYLQKKKLGKLTTEYRLKDWLISRQRYWGTPIPIIYCDKCGIMPVPEESLPLKLPEKVKFGEGNPLIKNKDFVNVKCPKCKREAQRETDTMDTFVNSSWYFLRYCDPKNKKEIFDKKKTSYWIPIDFYIGGREHATMHLIYIRFYTKFLRDLKLLRINEPAIRLFNQGMVHGEDKEKMSKSKGNVIDPLDIINKYSADSLRLFLISNASPNKDFDWDKVGLEISLKFIKKVYDFFNNIKPEKSNKLIEHKVNKTIKEVTNDINELKYNLAIIKIRNLFVYLEQGTSKKNLENFLKLLCPFCPHITEELWEKLGNKKFISLEKWPRYSERKIKPDLEAQEEFVYGTMADIRNIMGLIKIKPTKIIISVADNWKYKIFKKIKQQIKKTRDIGKIIKAVSEKRYTKDISKIVPNLIRNPDRIPETLIGQSKELEALELAKDKFRKEFNLNIEIAKNNEKAWPNKPAIRIE